jgi:predicted metal-dependent hydrolase
MSESLVVDGLAFTLRRSPRRSTVGITIDRSGELILAAPPDCSAEEIARIARRRQFWVYTKLAEKQLLFRPPPPKEFVTGEGFSYLGRSYRLLLVDAPAEASVPPLALRHGWFALLRVERERAQEHFTKWYIEHVRPWVQRRVELFSQRIGVVIPPVRIRDLGYRWGSCSSAGGLNFHWQVALLPPRIIEYIVAHELVHLHEPRHGSDFWRRLERAMPDYVDRKSWLAQNAALL